MKSDFINAKLNKDLNNLDDIDSLYKNKKPVNNTKMMKKVDKVYDKLNQK